MNKTMVAFSNIKLWLVLILMVAITVACGMSGPQATDTPPPPPPTNTPLPAPTETNTPEPTATPDLVATESAKSTEVADQLMGDIEETIDDNDIKISLDGGHIGWVQDETVTIALLDYGGYDFDPIAGEEEFTDFILRSQVTWDTSGIGLCGFAFRAEKDLEKGEQFSFSAVRFSGLPVYWLDYYNNGEWVYSLGGRGRINDAIDISDGATNEYVLVAKGNTLSVYANGTRLTNADIGKLKEGRIAFYAFQESGETVCEFNDTWLYVLNTED